MERLGAVLLAYHLGSLEGAAANEDGEPAEEALFRFCQQVVAPLQRVAQRLLAHGQVACATGEDIQTMGKAMEQSLRWEQLAPGSGQFERQRQAIQAHADLCDGVRISRGQLKGRLDGLRAQDKEAHRGPLQEGLWLWQLREIGERERGNRELLLSREVEGGSAGDEHAETRTGGEQHKELGCRLEQVLEVVQQQQQVPLAQRSPHLFLQGEISHIPQAERLGDRCQDPGRIADRGERHEADSIGKVVEQRLRHRQPQARFAHSSRSDEGQQTHVRTSK